MLISLTPSAPVSNILIPRNVSSMSDSCPLHVSTEEPALETCAGNADPVLKMSLPSLLKKQFSRSIPTCKENPVAGRGCLELQTCWLDGPGFSDPCEDQTLSSLPSWTTKPWSCPIVSMVPTPAKPSFCDVRAKSSCPIPYYTHGLPCTDATDPYGFLPSASSLLAPECLSCSAWTFLS